MNGGYSASLKNAQLFDSVETELEGQVDSVVFSNEENGYTVARLAASNRKNAITILGNMFSITPGETLKITGRWSNHPKYGEQFIVSSWQTTKPASAAGIEKYLGSGLIKGIGPVMAKRLVAMFGEETLDIIEKNIGRLREVEGIGEKRVGMIRDAWHDQKDIRDIMVFLQGHGVSPGFAVKIYRQYGQDSIDKVTKNPYRLAYDIHGIGFLTADRIAASLGMPKNSVMRAEAGVLYALHEMSEDGHVCAPYETLIKKSIELLSDKVSDKATEEKSKDIDRETIVKGIAEAALRGLIVIEDINDTADIIENNKVVFLSSLHKAETGIVRNIRRLLAARHNPLQIGAEDAVRRAQTALGVTLADAQAYAVRESLSRKALVITGGPGTGKTTIIKAIMHNHLAAGRTVILAAPTGRAAKRMSEATGQEAKTLHRLLEYSPQNNAFKKNEKNPLNAGLIVVDETSMVDTVLMHNFLKAVPDGASLLLVGDADQLPSVGAGNVLRDVMDSGCAPVVSLNEIFRQAANSMIIVNAHRVNRGQIPYCEMNKENASLQDFYFVEIEKPEDIVGMIINLCKNRIPQKFGFDPINDIQVIAPMHKGLIGVGNLNIELQKALNPNGGEPVQRMGRSFMAGDKVMQIVNNYDRDVFNGDIGFISGIDKENSELTVNYDGRGVKYDFNDLNELMLAYAMSIHKSQGSEFPAVIMPVHTNHYMLLQRNLLYTGLTRGKKLVVLTGTKKALGIAVRNNEQKKRHTRLKERLIHVHTPEQRVLRNPAWHTAPQQMGF